MLIRRWSVIHYRSKIIGVRAGQPRIDTANADAAIEPAHMRDRPCGNRVVADNPLGRAAGYAIAGEKHRDGICRYAPEHQPHSKKSGKNRIF